MFTSTIELEVPAVLNVTATDSTLAVDLNDGRSISVPLAWYPRLVHASQKERDNWRIIGQGHGLHWESLDEDISIENLLTGHRSGESQKSFERWLASRAVGIKP
jgi:hypothetical protein